MRPFPASSPCAKRSTCQPTRRTPAQMSMFSLGSTPARSTSKSPTSTGPTETSLSRGSKTTAVAESTTARSVISMPAGMIRGSNRCTSKPFAGRLALPHTRLVRTHCRRNNFLYSPSRSASIIARMSLGSTTYSLVNH